MKKLILGVILGLFLTACSKPAQYIRCTDLANGTVIYTGLGYLTEDPVYKHWYYIKEFAVDQWKYYTVAGPTILCRVENK